MSVITWSVRIKAWVRPLETGISKGSSHILKMLGFIVCFLKLCAIHTCNSTSAAEPHPDPESQHISATPTSLHSPLPGEASPGWAQHQRPVDVHCTCQLVVKHVSLFYRLNKKIRSKYYSIFFTVTIIIITNSLDSYYMLSIWLFCIHFLFSPCETLYVRIYCSSSYKRWHGSSQKSFKVTQLVCDGAETWTRIWLLNQPSSPPHYIVW